MEYHYFVNRNNNGSVAHAARNQKNISQVRSNAGHLLWEEWSNAGVLWNSNDASYHNTCSMRI